MAPQALLLAAGLGTRLRPLTDVLPKCLMPVCGRPLLGYWLELLSKAGFRTIVVNTHHHAEIVSRYISHSLYAGRTIVVHEDKLLGTGGTLLVNRERFGEEPILVAHADNISVFNPLEMLRHHRNRPSFCSMTMMTFETDDPASCGVVETDWHGVVTAFHEKIANPPGNRANAAVYVFEASILDELADLNREVIDLSTEVLPRMVGRTFTYHNERYHRDIGTFRSLVKAQFALPLSCPDWIHQAKPDHSWTSILESGEPTLADSISRAMSAALQGELRTP